MGYVGCDAGVTKEWLATGTWEVEVACQRYRARVQLEPLYDPKNEKIKA
jgi:4-methylaminobutanoate oxidase (formaldehyde-forming)